MDYREHLNNPFLALHSALEGKQSSMWTAMPATISQVNDLGGQMTVHVQPTIQARITGADQSTKFESLPVLPDVPVVFPHGGGYHLTFPLQVGDEVLVVFSSRCIDSWWAAGGVQKPFEPRMHDINDGFAIPGPFSAPAVPNGISTNTVQLRNTTQTQFLEIDNTNKVVRLVCGTENVTIDDTTQSIDVTAAKQVNITSGQSVTVTAATAIDFYSGNTHLHLQPGGASVLDLGGGTLSIINATSIHLNG